MPRRRAANLHDTTRPGSTLAAGSAVAATLASGVGCAGACGGAGRRCGLWLWRGGCRHGFWLWLGCFGLLRRSDGGAGGSAAGAASEVASVRKKASVARCGRDWPAVAWAATVCCGAGGSRGRIAVQDVDHNHVAETPVVHGLFLRATTSSACAGATVDADDIARHAARRADRHIAGELNQDVLTLLRHADSRSATADRTRHGRSPDGCRRAPARLCRCRRTLPQAAAARQQAPQAARQCGAASFEAGQQLVDVGLVHGHGGMLRAVQQRGLVRCGRPPRSLRRRSLLPNVATIWATFASIVFSVATTLVMRWPVMSWKLHAS